VLGRSGGERRDLLGLCALRFKSANQLTAVSLIELAPAIARKPLTEKQVGTDDR